MNRRKPSIDWALFCLLISAVFSGVFVMTYLKNHQYSAVVELFWLIITDVKYRIAANMPYHESQVVRHVDGRNRLAQLAH